MAAEQSNAKKNRQVEYSFMRILCHDVVSISAATTEHEKNDNETRRVCIPLVRRRDVKLMASYAARRRCGGVYERRTEHGDDDGGGGGGVSLAECVRAVDDNIGANDDDDGSQSNRSQPPLRDRSTTDNGPRR